MAGDTGLGEYGGNPDVLANMINPSSGRWELMATKLEDEANQGKLGFDVAAQTMGLGGPTFLRDALYGQQSSLRNQYLSQLSQGQIADTRGADYYNFLRQNIGAA